MSLGWIRPTDKQTEGHASYSVVKGRNEMCMIKGYRSGVMYCISKSC